MQEQMTPGPGDRIDCGVTESFTEWLAQANGCLAVSTYQAGKVAFIGHDGQQTHLLMRDFDKPLGLAIDPQRMALVTRHELMLFANAPLLAAEYQPEQRGQYDALYLPRANYFTGDLHAHDLAFGKDGLVMVNTRFSCLAGLSKDFSFYPTWRPKFVTDLVPEDRCHLNGLALRDGQPKWVTALGESDTPGGWRENKAAGGVLIDVESGEVIVRGLSMPHSPRWYNNQLWVLNSGTGELRVVNPETGESATVCALPGYLRGLAFCGPYALVGLSTIREKHIFGGLPIQQQFEKLLCGVAVVDLRTGTNVGLFEFTSGCTELYDVQFVPGLRRPMILNASQEAVRHAVTNPDSSWWLRPSDELPAEGPEASDRVSPDAASPNEPEAQAAGSVPTELAACGSES